MFLIIGLGNPGKKYIHTRHNLGFRALDEFQKENNFPVFRLSKKFEAEISKGAIGGQEVILAKPQAFMNESGRAVKKIFNLAKRQFSEASIFNQFSITQFSNKNLIIIHDDIDLPLGKIKISKGRGSAGHKGVESIIKELGTKEFVRIRIGIQPEAGKPVDLDEFVLKRFTQEEEKIIQESIKKSGQAIIIA